MPSYSAVRALNTLEHDQGADFDGGCEAVLVIAISGGIYPDELRGLYCQD